MLKETNDTCDATLQQHLIQHARELEGSLMKEATILCPTDPETGGECSYKPHKRRVFSFPTNMYVFCV
jgi:hypothetical protein